METGILEKNIGDRAWASFCKNLDKKCEAIRDIMPLYSKRTSIFDWYRTALKDEFLKEKVKEAAVNQFLEDFEDLRDQVESIGLNQQY